MLPWKSEGMVATPERFTKNSAYGILARVALYAAGYSLRWDLNTVPYNQSTLKIAQRSDAARIKELYQIAADACKAVITKEKINCLTIMIRYSEIWEISNIMMKPCLNMVGIVLMVQMFVLVIQMVFLQVVRTMKVWSKGGSQMIAMPTFYFEFEEDDQRRDVSVCNYGLKLSTGNNAYQMNTFAGMGVGKISY